MFINLKKRLHTNFINLKGWKTRRKLVVIESDDWGSIRVSSRKSVEKITPYSSLDSYNRYDSLESNDDLNALFEVLISFEDAKGNHPRFTINNIVANPDFEKIKENNFESYFFEPFTATLQKYPNSHNVETLYRQGIKEKIFVPQFHGREHLNVNKWMNSLRSGDLLIHQLFENKMFSINTPTRTNCKTQFLDAFGIYCKEDNEFLETAIKEGVELFHNIWGYYPMSVVSPCHTWDNSIENIFKKNNLKFIQSGHKQTFPIPDPKFGYKKRHFTGEKNELGQLYTIRNVIFEPALDSSKRWVNECLNQIERAFFWQKPAIISTHRLNYIGVLDIKNRIKNLESLKMLLNEILKKWPDAEFIDSAELGDEIAQNLFSTPPTTN